MTIASTTEVLTPEQTLPNDFEVFGRASLADYFGDMVVYRDLEPLNGRLPGLKASAGKMGISANRIPRKKEEDYALAANWLINKAQQIRGKSQPIQELLFVGDSLYNDGYVYRNLQQVSQWTGTCFIGTEQMDEPVQLIVDPEDGLYCANRWAALATWVGWALENGMHLDEQTVVIVDIDKTALGALGRNDRVIDRARLDGIYRTMNSVLGNNFDTVAFENQYAELNNPEYHCITADNQDYLAYLCLVMNTKLIQFDELVNEVQSGNMDDFEQFTRWVNVRMMINPIGSERLRQVHETVMACLHVGDPTPFKRFRRQEFVTTVERMGNVADDSSITKILENEIALTNEVCEVSKWFDKRDCLLLCLSDKPSEASCPDPDVLTEYVPVHEAQTHLVGTSIQSILDSL